MPLLLPTPAEIATVKREHERLVAKAEAELEKQKNAAPKVPTVKKTTTKKKTECKADSSKAGGPGGGGAGGQQGGGKGGAGGGGGQAGGGQQGSGGGGGGRKLLRRTQQTGSTQFGREVDPKLSLVDRLNVTVVSEGAQLDEETAAEI